MPVIKRSVEPIYVSRGQIPRDAKNELEAVAVNTLSGVIYQLSSLAYHAENIFAELFKEATGIFERTCNAQKRIEQLSVKVMKLDSAEEESMYALRPLSTRLCTNYFVHLHRLFYMLICYLVELRM